MVKDVYKILLTTSHTHGLSMIYIMLSLWVWDVEKIIPVDTIVTVGGIITVGLVTVIEVTVGFKNSSWIAKLVSLKVKSSVLREREWY